jgi:hypothetical protein
MTDVSDFNLRMVSLYSSRAFLVAGRFYDLAPDRWDKLACLWYARHNFFELKDDRYMTETMVRFKSVDALVAEVDPKMTPTAQHLYDQWMGIKKRLEESRKDKPIPIEPPKPTPTPLPIPDPIPEPKPEPKQEPEAPKKAKLWKLIAVVLGAIAFAIKFVPVVPAIVPVIIEWIVKILEAIPK